MRYQPYPVEVPIDHPVVRRSLSVLNTHEVLFVIEGKRISGLKLLQLKSYVNFIGGKATG